LEQALRNGVELERSSAPHVRERDAWLALRERAIHNVQARLSECIEPAGATGDNVGR